ncbi:MAG: adenylate/guanylate cyclase domain-containing protein [Merismopedia sp. SIO2A8]|nr:adenylate/guanylate cyclase domain-containing protein [Merismopedia sp. SIO2A8]
MSELESTQSRDHLLQEISALRQQVADLKIVQTDLELLQEVTTEHSDDVLAELEHKNQLIRKIFGRYLTDEVVTTLLDSPAALKLGGERCMVSILVADLRGFTALSEYLSAEDVIKVLNWYLGHMTDVITRYDGIINDLTGDGLMVLFGAPTVRNDDAQRAVTCAIAMQLAMDTVNLKLDEWGLPRLQMGIGINTGEAVVGNIGSEKHTKYSAIGKQVNLAYRIESYTVGGQVLISGQTLELVKPLVIVDERIQIIPKGLSQPITVFSLKGIRDDDALVLPHEEQLLRRLPVPVFVQFVLLDGKQMSGKVWPGQIIKLSSRGAELSLQSSDNRMPPLVPMSDLKLNLFLGDRAYSPEIALANVDLANPQHRSDDIYAKVLHKDELSHTVFIYFTTIRPAEADYLKKRYEALGRDQQKVN